MSFPANPFETIVFFICWVLAIEAEKLLASGLQDMHFSFVRKWLCHLYSTHSVTGIEKTIAFQHWLHSFQLADIHGLLLMLCEMLSNIHSVMKAYTAEGGA